MFCGFLIIPNSIAATNINADSGDYGSFATDNNRDLLLTDIRDDITPIQTSFDNQIKMKDYVPVEARIGKAFINAMTYLSGILENTLIRFVGIFLIVMFAFWIILESYQMMKETHKPFELFKSIMTKAILITIWIMILEQGPAQLFMLIAAPILAVGTFISDFILSSVGAGAGFVMSDTCSAIHKYVNASDVNTSLIASNQIADLLCLPTRMSGFFYMGISAGWNWTLYGIGTSAFTCLMGVGLIILCLYNIWKFAIAAFGVIADLFLVLFMLPFTAIAQVFGGKDKGDNPFNVVSTAVNEGGVGKTSYAGIAGQIFNGFFDLFKPQSLPVQFKRFTSAVLYFVSLSFIIAICSVLLSSVMTPDIVNNKPTLETLDAMPVIITLVFIAYIINKLPSFIEKFGGSIDTSFGDKVKKDGIGLWKAGKNTYKKYFGKQAK